MHDKSDNPFQAQWYLFQLIALSVGATGGWRAWGGGAGCTFQKKISEFWKARVILPSFTGKNTSSDQYIRISWLTLLTATPYLVYTPNCSRSQKKQH